MRNRPTLVIAFWQQADRLPMQLVLRQISMITDPDGPFLRGIKLAQRSTTWQFPYYQVDVFTSELFAGNPAGVCILSVFLADSTMQKIAAENRHSETAFVVPRADGDFDLRWFTPKVEDDLCGHATLASAYVLALRKHSVWPVRFHTCSGMLTVAQGQDSFEMDFPARPPQSCEMPVDLLPALGLIRRQPSIHTRISSVAFNWRAAAMPRQPGPERWE